MVNPANNVSDITAQQAADIYNGKITNWKELGGTDAPITLYTREDGSGTREVFVERALNKGSIVQSANVVNSNGAMKTAVAQDKQSIGYVGIGHVDKNVKALVFDKMVPSQENASNGTYKVTRLLFMNTKAGFLLRAEGDNPAVVATLARDGGLVKIEGLIIANALVALSGAVMAQKNRVFEISMGTGAIVFGLAAVIIGTNIFKNRQKVNSSTAAIVGSIIYKACVALALSMGLVPQDLKLVTAALFLIILVLGNVRRKKVKFHA